MDTWQLYEAQSSAVLGKMHRKSRARIWVHSPGQKRLVGVVVHPTTFLQIGHRDARVHLRDRWTWVDFKEYNEMASSKSPYYFRFLNIWKSSTPIFQSEN